MDAFPIQLISRILHILGAIFLLGGTFFVAFALRPAAETLPEVEHNAFKERLMKRWRQLVGIAIGLLIFSGFYNYLIVAAPEHSDAGDKKYHMYMGIKILIAFVVFFIASVLPGRAAAFEKMRQNNKQWTLLAIILGIIVVSIGSFLRIRGIPG